MNVYIITLVNNSARMKNATYIKNNLKLSFNVSIYPACIPKDNIHLEQGYDSQFRAKKFGYDLAIGELGCFQSHRNVWSKFLESGDDICCVLEDDAILSPDFDVAVNAAVKRKEQWDICRLHCSFDYGFRVTICSIDNYILSYDMVPPRGTTGYLLSRIAAEILLKKSVFIREPVDHFVDNVRLHGLTVLSLRPHPISVMEILPSEIGRRGWNVASQGRRTFWRGMQRDMNNFIEQFFCFKKAIYLVYAKLTHNPLSKNRGNGL